ncbi:RAD51A, partial [Tribonema minus]
IERLVKAGVSAADIQQLQKAGIATVGILFRVTTKILRDIRGFNKAKVATILQAASKVDSKAGVTFQSGIEARNGRMKIMKISTGSDALNSIFGGGVETGSITEIHGEFGMGKTQMMHTLAVTAQLRMQNGSGGGRVIFMDTDNTFTPERIKTIADRFDVDGHEVRHVTEP